MTTTRRPLPIRLAKRLCCWLIGHEFHYDQIGPDMYKFCCRCDRMGEIVATLPSEEVIGFPTEFANRVAEIYDCKEETSV